MISATVAISVASSLRSPGLAVLVNSDHLTRRFSRQPERVLALSGWMAVEVKNATHYGHRASFINEMQVNTFRRCAVPTLRLPGLVSNPVLHGLTSMREGRPLPWAPFCISLCSFRQLRQTLEQFNDGPLH
jgi:hypothetical protein